MIEKKKKKLTPYETTTNTAFGQKDGSPLSQERAVVDGGNLTIDKIQEQDRGLYQCSASNGAATVVADTELVILSFPPR